MTPPPHIVVDGRVGSKDLVAPLTALGACVTCTHQDFGDASWVGGGPEGVPILVGVEVKTIDDLLSCIETRRLVDHQLPGLLASYNVVYLVVEGIWGPQPQSGLLQIHKHGRVGQPANGRRWLYKAVSNFLLQMETRVGVRVHRTINRDETVHHILESARSWGEEWESHESFVPYAGADILGGAASFRAPTLLWEVANRLPGVGRKALTGGGKRRKVRVDQVFSNVREMVGYTGLEKWMEVGLGEGQAKALQAALDAPGSHR